MPFPAKTSAETILSTALDMLESQGAAEMSMRGLAQKLGLAPNALYRYYASREALLAALAAIGAEALQQDLQRAVADLAGRKALRALVAPYLAFARDRPHLYAVIVPADPQGEPGSAPVRQKPFALIVGLLEGVVAPEHAEVAALALWSYLHGAAGLDRAGFFAGRAADMPFWGFKALVRSLKRLD